MNSVDLLSVLLDFNMFRSVFLSGSCGVSQHDPILVT